ncbi:hypothetical protein DSECCO2_595720 [anaerobic digester metagenome]
MISSAIDTQASKPLLSRFAIAAGAFLNNAGAAAALSEQPGKVSMQPANLFNAVRSSFCLGGEMAENTSFASSKISAAISHRNFSRLPVML